MSQVNETILVADGFKHATDLSFVLTALVGSLGKLPRCDARTVLTTFLVGYFMYSSSSASASGRKEEETIPNGYEGSTPEESATIKKYDEDQQIESWVYWYHVNANYPMALYILLVHIGAAYGVTYLTSCSMYTLLFTVSLYFLSAIGITAGSHRLWSHRSFKAGN